MSGDPTPIVSWHRENGNLPEGRSRILLDNTLRIEDARPEDQGRYFCKGHNEGGNVTVSVRLYVYGMCLKCRESRFMFLILCVYAIDAAIQGIQ